MPANEYYFVSHWRVPCTPEEAFEILHDPALLPRWWPAGFLSAEPHTFADGVEGVALATQGWLPLVLRFTLRELSSDSPGSLVVEAKGDLEGRGIWTLMQDGDYTDITFDWRVTLEKPGMKQLAPVLKPVCESNHNWIMKKGEQSLRLELMRRRATSEPVRNAIEAPPGPMSIPIVPIAAGIGLLLLWKLRPRRKKTRREQAAEIAGSAVAAAAAQARQTRKQARQQAKQARKQLSRQSDRARHQLETAIERAQSQGGGVRDRAASLLERTDVDERVGAALNRLEAAIERANIPERVEAARERVVRTVEEEVPGRLQAARKRVRRRNKGLFGRWRH